MKRDIEIVICRFIRLRNGEITRVTAYQTTHYSANHVLINENRHPKHMIPAIITNKAIRPITLIVIRRFAHTTRINATIPRDDPTPIIRQTIRAQIHKKSRHSKDTRLANNVRHSRATKYVVIVKASTMRSMNVAHNNTTTHAANKNREMWPVRRDNEIRFQRTTGDKLAL